MKYRILVIDNNEFDVIVEDGGVASIYKTEDGFSTMYYQSRITEATTKDEADEILSNGKAYVKEWEGEPTMNDFIRDAQEWLVVGESDWERDDSIFTNIY